MTDTDFTTKRLSDTDLGPQVNFKQLRLRLYETRISHALFAGLVGISEKTFQLVLSGKSPATLRVRYRIAVVVKRLSLDDGTIITGRDALATFFTEDPTPTTKVSR